MPRMSIIANEIGQRSRGGKSNSTGGQVGGTANTSVWENRNVLRQTGFSRSRSVNLTASSPGMTSQLMEKKARLMSKSLVALRNDEMSRLQPPLMRGNQSKPRQTTMPPMWDRSTLSSTVQPTAFPCNPRDEKTWMGTTGYPLVYPGDHRHEWTTVEFHGRDYPRRPWKLTANRCLAAEEFKGKVSNAADSFDMMRPQQTTAEHQTRAPRWRTISLGDKLVGEGCADVKQNADSTAWETMRPMQDQPPPWAHIACPRARFVQASCMSASPFQ